MTRTYTKNVTLVNERKAKAERLAARYRAGETLEQIGQSLGVTRERVRQIMTKYAGITAKDGGLAVRAEINKQKRIAARNDKCLRLKGCSVEQYRGLLALKKPLRDYHGQKRNAGTRGIGWQLNLWQWWTIWQDSGHWHERGRCRGQYVMCRRNDTGPYAVGNVYIATNKENLQDYWADVASGLRTRGSFVSEQAA